jgi:hypothetical protein
MIDIEKTVSPSGVVVEDIALYNQHVVHYFDTQLNSDIQNLDPKDKERLFLVMKDNADIFAKIFHKGMPLIEFIVYGDQWYSAKQNPHGGINWDYDCELVKQYKVWLQSKENEQS